jgi:hypothetical protein
MPGTLSDIGDFLFGKKALSKAADQGKPPQPSAPQPSSPAYTPAQMREMAEKQSKAPSSPSPSPCSPLCSTMTPQKPNQKGK